MKNHGVIAVWRGARGCMKDHGAIELWRGARGKRGRMKNLGSLKRWHWQERKHEESWQAGEVPEVGEEV
jgi:hypothetical protein